MIDAELVIRKLVLITSDLAALRPIADKPLDAYLASETDEILAERYVERIIGRMIDVNYHLITESGQPPPPDYFESFTRLGPLGMLDPEFARRIAACAGLRSRIVHEYEEIDPRKVHEGLQAAMRDIPSYLRAANEYLSKTGR